MASNPPIAQPGVAAAPNLPPRLGPKILVLGGTGNGKTTALKTLLRAPGVKEVFVLFTENGMAAVADTPADRFHWQYIPATMPNMRSQKIVSEAILNMDRKQLASYQDPSRMQYKQFVQVFAALEGLKCDRTGKTFGSVEGLGHDVVFVLDSLTGISIMAKQMVGGIKPVFDQGEWGMAMERIQYMIQNLCMSVRCPVIVNAHEEREEDQITQGTKIMVSALGRKLAPKLPLFFDDVIYAYRNQDKWLWSTNYPGVADLKSRHLGIFHARDQDYIPVFQKWQQGG